MVVMVLACAMPFDQVIATYNLSHHNSNEIDVDHYLDLSSNAYPVIYANLDRIERQMQLHAQNKEVWVSNLDIEVFKAELDQKRDRFRDRYEDAWWPSWNWADAKTYRLLAET